MSQDKFYHFTHLPKLDVKYALPCQQGSYTNVPTTPSGGVVNWSLATDFKNTKFCQDLIKEFGEPSRVFYYKNAPMTHYGYHKDKLRNCSLNFLLTPDPNYLTLYREESDVPLMIRSIENCVYQLLYPTLLDTTHEHTVINYSNKPRYILSVQPGMATYQETKEYLLNYQCEHY